MNVFMCRWHLNMLSRFCELDINYNFSNRSNLSKMSFSLSNIYIAKLL